jgi:hypothetical protein
MITTRYSRAPLQAQPQANPPGCGQQERAAQCDCQQPFPPVQLSFSITSSEIS